MKNEILDTPIRDSFEDCLHKDEIIQWEKTIDEDIQTPIIFNDEGQLKFNLRNLAYSLLVAISITALFFYYIPPGSNSNIILLLFFSILISWLVRYKIYSTKIHPTQYAITSKRILFRLSHLPKNEIHDIPFSQIHYCNVTIEEGNSGTIFLTVKNSEVIPFETFTYVEDDKKEWRHQPTLESIDEVNQVAELIRKGIENENR